MQRFLMSLPVQMLFTIVLALYLANNISVDLKQQLYALSLAIKDCLVLFLPLIIFCLIFSSMVRLAGSALLFVAYLFAAVVVSNFITTNFAYLFSGPVISNMDLGMAAQTTGSELLPSWQLSLPKTIDNRYAMLTAFAAAYLGILFQGAKPSSRKFFHKIADILDKANNFILTRCFSRILPIFILGFLLKLEHEGLLGHIASSYGFILLAVVGFQFFYVFLMYFVASGFNLKKMFFYLKNIFPAWTVGMATMSSAAALPLVLDAAKKNTGSSDMVKMSVPVTTNVHLVGDCIAIPIFALAIMATSGMSLPGPHDFLVFSLYFVLAKFAVAAVPAGGILIMLPVLAKQLGFSTEMSFLITSVYIMADPLITSANVLGNGAFAVLLNKSLKIFNLNFALPKTEPATASKIS